jgi:hypothetical protein
MEHTEMWRTIQKFPAYAVSNYGRIINQHTDEVIRPSLHSDGYLKVNLRAGGLTHTRSCALLTAFEWCEVPAPHADAVVVLNGILSDLRAHNLVWRDRGFGWQYARQLKEPWPIHWLNLPVISQGSGVGYANVITAGTEYGLLFHEIWESTYTGKPPRYSTCSFVIA